ncbi:heavy metal-binding domain-containing protein [Henriciella sp.]|uniref:heavy metal-binding domain-containing protein n=1 Tax=Henriciella sp. TaxID=1968823 RepID=UPI0026386227|nr:heavy metal-binding domain-containing protein [Henriciella sp.]
MSEYMWRMSGVREQGLDRMHGDAQSLGADAIDMMRLTTSMIMGGSAELLAFGTAFKLP